MTIFITFYTVIQNVNLATFKLPATILARHDIAATGHAVCPSHLRLWKVSAE